MLCCGLESLHLRCFVLFFFLLTLLPPAGHGYQSGSGENSDREVELSLQEDSAPFIHCVTAHKRWHNKGFGIKQPSLLPLIQLPASVHNSKKPVQDVEQNSAGPL